MRVVELLKKPNMLLPLSDSLFVSVEAFLISSILPEWSTAFVRPSIALRSKLGVLTIPRREVIALLFRCAISEESGDGVSLILSVLLLKPVRKMKGS